MTLRLRLAELSHERGMALKELAFEMDVDYQTILNWNHGRAFPSLQRTVELAMVLGVLLDDLIEHKNYQHWINSQEQSAQRGLIQWSRYIQQFKHDPKQWGEYLSITYKLLF